MAYEAMEAVMKTVQSFGNSLLTSRRTLAITVLAGAAIAALTIHAQGAVQLTPSEGKPASGTVAVTDRTILMSYHDGRELVQERFVHRKLTGTFAGTEVAVVHYVIHPDGSATIRGASTCSCTIEGRAGTVTFIEEGTVSAAGNISVLRRTIDATGGLAGLSATLNVTGPIAAPTQNYSGHYSFGDDD
jgi:hypothetical protein